MSSRCKYSIIVVDEVYKVSPDLIREVQLSCSFFIRLMGVGSS
jgi:hypothetical protein